MYHIGSKPLQLECVEMNFWIFNTFSKQDQSTLNDQWIGVVL